jgi:hypothetical protein
MHNQSATVRITMPASTNPGTILRFPGDVNFEELKTALSNVGIPDLGHLLSRKGGLHIKKSQRFWDGYGWVWDLGHCPSNQKISILRTILTPLGMTVERRKHPAEEIPLSTSRGSPTMHSTQLIASGASA